MKKLLIYLILLYVHQSQAQILIQIPSSQEFDNHNIELNIWVFSTQSQTDTNPKKKPAVIMLHGCGGAYNGKGEISTRMLEYAKLFNQRGWDAYVLDSFTTRGVKQICTQSNSKRVITPLIRSQDLLDAHQWISSQADVDSEQIAYIGWSNGGSTVLSATNLNNTNVANSQFKPAAASVFYPGCVGNLNLGYRPNVQMLIQIGESDDWTHPEPCKRMVHNSNPPQPILISYPDSYHQFDSEKEIKIRFDVGSKRGVHYGGNSKANLAAKENLIAFFSQAFARSQKD